MDWIARYKLYFLGTFLITLLAYNALSLPLVQTNAELAFSADSFVDSVGIVIKLQRRSSAYSRYDDLIKPKLQELGIRHIRDEGRPTKSHMHEKFNDLATFGIKSTLIMDPRWKITPENAVSLAKTVAPALEAVGGPNEWDLHLDLNYQEKNYPQGVRTFQTDLYKAIKADPATAHLPVLSSSVAKSDRILELGELACDIGNIHSYPRPGKLPHHKLDKKWIPAAITACDSQSIMATETGYHNAINKYGVSEQASAKYLPRLLLEYYNRGIQRTYIHQLLDLEPNPTADRPGLNYGLLRYDGSPKPAFIALKNLLDLLQEPQRSNTNSKPLESLDYTLVGDTENIHHTLLQKRTGQFYLILWQDTLSYDVRNKKDILVSPRSLKLVLKTKISKAKAYQPLYSRQAFQQYDNPQQIALQVADHPLVLKLVPQRLLAQGD